MNHLRNTGIYIILLLSAAGTLYSQKLPEMIILPGGRYMMGADDANARSDEMPVHEVTVESFAMSSTEITNAMFKAFVDATGYVTTAEQIPDYDEIVSNLPPGSPLPDKEDFRPGSMIFMPASGPVPLDNPALWWRFLEGASWKAPLGEGSSIDGYENHPVVHVSWYDARAYAEWAGGRLPTEIEWEYAARGGLEQKAFPWGNEALETGALKANTWTGNFPYMNDQSDGAYIANESKSYPPNAYGLYDMAGNVWEWTADWYNAEIYSRRSGSDAMIQMDLSSDAAETLCYDPAEPWARKRSIRGGSFLCHESYCEGYRVSSRMKSTPDTSLIHTGFRIVKDLK